MNTLRPNDFFLGEDSPATVEPSNGLLVVKMPVDTLATINSVLSIPEDWEGDSVRVNVLYQSSGDPAIASMNIRLDSWSESSGPVTGVVNTVSTNVESINPMIVRSTTAIVEVPEGFTAGGRLVLMLYPNVSGITEGYLPKIVGVEYSI